MSDEILKNEKMDNRLLHSELFEMDYPNNPQENRLYDGQSHNVFPQRLVRAFLPNGKESYILEYVDDNRIMLTFVNINGRVMTKIPLDKSGYEQINIEDLFYQGIDCSDLLNLVERHIFCKPITDVLQFLSLDDKNDDKVSDNTRVLYATMAQTQQKPYTEPPQIHKEEVIYSYDIESNNPPKQLLDADNKSNKSMINIFIDSDNRRYLGSDDYNRIFLENKKDINYLPLEEKVAGHINYCLLNDEEIKTVESRYSINSIKINSINIFRDDVDDYLTNDLYNNIFNEFYIPTPSDRNKYTKLTTEEKEFINKYYCKHYVVLNKKQDMNVDASSPKCICSDDIRCYFIRPDIANNYNLEGIPVKVQYKDSNGNDVEKTFLDISLDKLFSSNIIPDMNNNHETYHTNEITIESKKPHIFDIVCDQYGKEYVISNRLELEKTNLLDLAKKQTIIEDEIEEPRWVLEITLEKEKLYKLMAKDIYPIFVLSSRIIKTNETDDDYDRPMSK